jgi:hypothetical protein
MEYFFFVNLFFPTHFLVLKIYFLKFKFENTIVDKKNYNKNKNIKLK